MNFLNLQDSWKWHQIPGITQGLEQDWNFEKKVKKTILYQENKT